MSNWTLLSNHGHVLVCLSRDSDARLRDIATDVGITERAVQKIVRDLQQSGMVSVSKNGRRNSYRIHKKVKLRHELESQYTVGDLMQVVSKVQETTPPMVVRSIEPKPVRLKSTEPREPEPAVVEQSPLESQQDSTKPSKPKKAHEKQQGSLF